MFQTDKNCKQKSYQKELIPPAGVKDIKKLLNEKSLEEKKW